MPHTIRATPPTSMRMAAELTRTLKAQRAVVVVEPIHAELAPVLAYIAHIAGITGKKHHAVTIPEGTTAHACGYRYVSIPGEELAYYLDNGASLASQSPDQADKPAAERPWFICTHQSGAYAAVEAPDGAEAIEKFRRTYQQPAGSVTARHESLSERIERERSVRGTRYQRLNPPHDT